METIIIDPAGNAPLIQDKCKKMELKPIAILLTHGHFDHIMATEDVKSIYQIPVYAGSSEEELLFDPYINCSNMLNLDIKISADHWLSDNAMLDVGEFSIKVIHTPGHTSGSVCYYMEKENVLFSGDTLFRDGFGRTDLPTGDFSTLVHSIKEKLFVLPDDVTVYPGHGDRTTIAYEKSNNALRSFV